MATQARAQSGAALRPALEEAGSTTLLPRAGAGPRVRDQARPRAVRRGPVRRGDVGRPAGQNFRSLERPPNLAVVAPRAPATVSQGLPPPAPPRRILPVLEENPFAPLGFQVGLLRLRPGIESSIGYDDNPNRTSSGIPRRGSIVYREAADLAVQSDWAVHELTADLRGGYSFFRSAPEANRPDAAGRIGLRLDVLRDTTVTLEGRGRLETERPGSVNLTSAVIGRPIVASYGASAGVTQRFNRLGVTVQGLFDRNQYETARLTGGGTLDQRNRNYQTEGLRLGLAYEIDPGVVPFVETIVDQRIYDLEIDAGGLRRSSRGIQARAGTTFGFTRTLTGQIAGGWGQRSYDDPGLRDLRGPIIEGLLAWSVTPLTTVRLRGQTQFEETTSVGSAGAISRTASADITHALLRNLNLIGQFSFQRSVFQGIGQTDDTYRATLGADWSLTRSIVLRASYVFDRTLSSAPQQSVSSNAVLFGIRLQY